MADKCQDHPTHELKLFCDTCKVALCAECSVINHRPPEHTNRYLSDVAEEYRQELMQMTEQLKEKEESDKRTESVAMATQNSLTLKFEMEKKKLSERASEIVRNVKERETQLMRELETEYSLYQKRSELQIEKIKIEKESVHSTLGNIENIIESNNATSMVANIEDTRHRFSNMINMTNTMSLQDDCFEFCPQEFVETDLVGFITSTACPSLCSLENLPTELVKGESTNIRVVTRDFKGKQIISNKEVKVLVKKPDGSTELITSKNNKNGTHTVTITAHMAGIYAMSIVINEHNITESPMKFPVIQGLIKTIGQKGNEVGQFNKPTGVIVNHDGDIVVADKGNDRLQVINRNGQCKHIIEYKKFCKKYKCSPFDVAISSNGLYYSLDVAHNIVVVTDDEGNILRYFGMGKLKAPTGVTIGPDGLVYIVDCYVIAHIKIFTQEGEFVRSFICNKSKLSIPFSVVVSNHRKVYMVDSNVGRIAVYYENGTFLYDVPIGGKPQGLAIDKDGYLYVTFFENKIIKFDETGNIIGRIDKDSDNINKPTGIIVTDDMKIVVADTGNHCVRVFV